MTRYLLLALSLLASTVALAASKEDKLYLYTESFPPYNMSTTGKVFEHHADGISGLCTDMLKAILAEAKVPYSMKLRNWDYSYDKALKKKNHGVFCTTYTEDRAPLFKWIGPLAENEWTVFAPPGSTLRLSKLEDAKGMTIGGYKGDVMTEYLLKRGYTVSQLDSDDLNPKRLVLGQIDLWIADRLAGPYFAAQQDIEDLVPVFSFNKTELFLALNPQTDDALVQKLKAAYDRIRKNGMFDSIRTKYGL
ncbi:transporter substrate-binding domain-containing protein [Hahella sp. SMD15-11]|uniref:Transporter substrate-binding domain-containing protein n=1 Tax=Thermohahella caldifontis TaxID=3142973 RepID=A0AB39USK6_9GAMM